MTTRNSPEKAAKKQGKGKAEFTEGLDFYYENGLMVLTAHFLKNRGYCCGNNCRHCPYPKTEREGHKR